MFIIFIELISLLILFLFKNPYETPKKVMIKLIVKIGLISIVISTLLSFIGESHIVTNSTYDLVEIDMHPKSSLSISDYISGDKVLIMDKDHNLYNIDFDNCEVRWCKNIYDTRVYKKVYNISPILSVLFPSNQYTDQYIIEFNDYYGTDTPLQ